MKNHVCVTILFVLSFLSCKNEKKVDEDVQPFKSGKGHALLVGVSETKIDGYDPISGVSRNLSKMKRILRARKFEKVQTLDKKPKATEITTALKENLYSLKEDDLFVFYFFGHGDQKEDNQQNEEEDSLDEYLIAYDSIILDDEINSILKNSNTKGRVVFIIESCHSGSLHQVLGDAVIAEEILKVDEKSFPNFIYLGATTDPKEAPLFSGGGIYTNRLYRIWDRRKGDESNYREFQKELDKLKEKPVLIDTYASEDFINQLFLKI